MNGRKARTHIQLIKLEKSTSIRKFFKFSCLFRVSTWRSRVCIDIHETRYTKHDVFVFRVPNSAVQCVHCTHVQYTVHKLYNHYNVHKYCNNCIYDQYNYGLNLLRLCNQTLTRVLKNRVSCIRVLTGYVFVCVFSCTY